MRLVDGPVRLVNAADMPRPADVRRVYLTLAPCPAHDRFGLQPRPQIRASDSHHCLSPLLYCSPRPLYTKKTEFVKLIPTLYDFFKKRLHKTFSSKYIERIKT